MRPSVSRNAASNAAVSGNVSRSSAFCVAAAHIFGPDSATVIRSPRHSFIRRHRSAALRHLRSRSARIVQKNASRFTPRRVRSASGDSGVAAAFLETLGRIAVNRGDYAGFEGILNGLEKAPKDRDHDHMAALARRLVAQDRWLLLVDAAFANRALDPALPRLLQRDPDDCWSA